MRIKNLAYFALPVQLILLICSMNSCVERNNPWDPVNTCSPEQKNLIIEQTAPIFDSILAASASVLAGAVAIDSLYRGVQMSNDSIDSVNASNRLANSAMDSLNSVIDSANLSGSLCDSSTKKELKAHMELLKIAGLVDSLAMLHNRIGVDSLKIISLIKSGNDRCQPSGLYSSDDEDSLLRILSGFSDSISTFAQNATRYDSLISDSANESLRQRNEDIMAYNAAVHRYNDSIQFNIAFCNIAPVVTGDSLLKRVQEARAGDTVLLDTGVFTAPLRFTHSGTVDQPILMLGSPDLRSRIVQSDIFISNINFIYFRNLVFEESPVDGIKLEDGSQGCEFVNCIFRSNGSHGLSIVDSDIKIRNSRIYNNIGSGIHISSSISEHSRIDISNTLIAHNRLNGINSLTAQLDLSWLTVSDNGQDGLRLKVPKLPITIRNCLITYNEGYAISRERVDGEFTVAETNFFANADGIFDGDTAYTPQSTFLYDPFYIDRATNDYGIDTPSVIYELEQLGVIIGFRNR
ncbi:MAG: hypothetical protein GF398_00255 [Chitinivibrionales bacterium]|nr:hypothetical protein [Chitinivibrionales bacterium]